MTWADKLREKKINIPKDLAIKGSVIFIEGYNKAQDDLVLVVLEKNKEIEKLARKSQSEFVTAFDGAVAYSTAQQAWQARAFRELVSMCEKVRK